MPNRNGLYTAYGKRFFDLVGSVALLAISAPIHLACAAFIRLDDRGPIYFRQERIGWNGQPFILYKLRTMVVGTHERSGGYPTSSMVTKPGRTLRRFSLDELPQLWNIIRGDMSFVGPRPALPDQVIRYTETQRRRLLVRPGLTGAAQIKYRNNAPWSARILEDIRYVENVSARGDLKLLLRTIPSALAGEGQAVGQTADQVDDLGNH